jgi:hypothetical protein
VVPADDKWFRDVAVAEAIVEQLRPLSLGWSDSLAALGEVRLRELHEYRARGGEE